MILKSLWRRKTRTLLTLSGIAVGVATVVALSAFGEGLAGNFEKMFDSAKADLTVGQKDAIMLIISSVDEEVGDELRQTPGVSQVVGTTVGIVQLPEAPYFIVMGEDPRGFAIQYYRLIAGGPLAGRKQILLGKTTADNFKKGVGEVFRINEVSYRVAGIYETGVSMEDGGAVMSLEDAQRAFQKRGQVSYFSIKLKDPRRADEIKKQIESRWPDLAATRSGESTQQAEVFNLYRSFGSFLGLFAALVGGLGMMNTMLMSVLERTREIGVLRALGWRRRRIIGLILGEVLALTLSGGLLGVALGIGLTSLTQLVPAVESLLQGVFTPAVFVQAMGIALLLGLIGGAYPAWRAAQFTPLEAMRYESGAGTHLGPGARLLLRFFGKGALRNLWRRPTRTLVTMLGIGIGVGFIVALIAMTDGFVVSFNSLAEAGQTDLLAQQANASDLGFSEIDERVADRLAARPEIKSVSRIFFNTSTAPGLPYFLVFGLDPSEDYIKHYRLREGRMFSRSGEIVIGHLAANSLKKKVGDTLRVSGLTYKIVGIYENGSMYEDTGGTMSLEDAQNLFNKPNKSSLLAIRINEPERADEIARQLEAQYPEVLVSKASSFVDRIQDFRTTYAMLNTLITITIIVGGIVMMNAMLMSVFERTQEIGVLRALGWGRRRVIGMVVAESIALSLLSAVAGAAIGVGLNYLFTLVPAMGGFLTPAYSTRLFLQVTILALGFGLIGGLYPAWRAAGLRPIEALRYE
jgi:ABC-type antimicrobial peptide transport system permease subunit